MSVAVAVAGLALFLEEGIYHDGLIVHCET